MKKVGIIYWSASGNTEVMATEMAAGATAKGYDVTLNSVTEADAGAIKEYDVIALGCPSMGAEVLEEAEFEPFYQEIKADLASKDVILFGSYGWGSGEWMENWQEDIKEAGANLLKDGIMANYEPDEQAKEECRNAIQ